MIKELIVAGNSRDKAGIVFGNVALDNNAVFEVDGKIKGLIGTGLENYFSMSGSFWTISGQTTNVTVRSKGFELGVEGYGGGVGFCVCEKAREVGVSCRGYFMQAIPGRQGFGAPAGVWQGVPT